MKLLRVLFVEPPKDIWFVMGEYLPPPFGIIQLAAYLEREVKDVEIKVLDCNAQKIDWKELEEQISIFNPDVVASSSLATCNAFLVVRTLETAKKVSNKIITVAGGQHFTATAEESLERFPEIDVIVRGEGEQTLTELIKNLRQGGSFTQIKGLCFRHEGRIVQTEPRPLIENLDTLPYPGYHFVKNFIKKYHFSAMAGISTPYALVEGSRGCPHRCTFCSQWNYWCGTWRKKTPGRIADEMAYCHDNFGSRFIWLTDDNFGIGEHGLKLANEIIRKKLSKDFMWFTQMRCDDVVRHQGVLPKLRESGLRWVLLGIESSDISTLETFKKDISPTDAINAVKLLKKNDIFAQAMFIIGERKHTAKSIAESRDFMEILDPDFVIYAILTPFPGTQLYEEAKNKGWIQDSNWSNYDMVHAVMPTETLSRKEVQEELYVCYRRFYGSWKRRLQGLFSRNRLKRRVYWYMLGRGILNKLEGLVNTF